MKGAVKILSSDEGILPFSTETLSKLKEQHPQRYPDSVLPDPPIDGHGSISCKTNSVNVSKAIFSFKEGSSAGLDGLMV